MSRCHDGAAVDTGGYAPFVAELLSLAESRNRQAEWSAKVDHALDGLASERLRTMVPLATRRTGGLFFTGSAIADDVVASLYDSLEPTSTIYDPACGAGDLLLAANKARISKGWTGVRLVGSDLQSEFVAAANLRLGLATPPEYPAAIVEVECGLCADRWEHDRVTHLVVNPPFALRKAPRGLTWSSGRTSSAAMFIADLLETATPGTEIAAILPDVLLSGSRYGKWRRHVEGRAAVHTVSRLGSFDRWTDVDTFLLVLTVGDTGGAIEIAHEVAGVTVGDLFQISVGAVVHNRDLHAGPEVAFLKSAGLPVSTPVTRIAGRRRFGGRVEEPPFVVVRRTSSPREPVRARATVVLGKRGVAVDNHLLVLHPKDGSKATCTRALDVLGSEATSKWLNRQIACRHLTVGSVGRIPWIHDRA
jgi:hypothetical protein